MSISEVTVGMIGYSPFNSGTTTNSQGYIGTGSSTTANSTSSGSLTFAPTRYLDYHSDHLAIHDALKIELKDGTILDIDNKGNFKIIDKDAKVTYKSNNVREFNEYINASNLVEKFIRFLGSNYKVRQDQVLKIPIELFIIWLIAEAAEKDGEPAPIETKLIPEKLSNRHKGRCRYCGKFIPKKLIMAGINFCNQIHFNSKLGNVLIETI